MYLKKNLCIKLVKKNTIILEYNWPFFLYDSRKQRKPMDNGCRDRDSNGVLDDYISEALLFESCRRTSEKCNFSYDYISEALLFESGRRTSENCNFSYASVQRQGNNSVDKAERSPYNVTHVNSRNVWLRQTRRLGIALYFVITIRLQCWTTPCDYNKHVVW